jgi:RNA polymerase sigma factor (sigma-70 family)
MDRIDVAEDIASDTFLTAAETWGQKGMPANPVAWLYNVAKNKALNYLQREALFATKVARTAQEEWTAHENEVDLSPGNINDSQLQMMFAICHRSIPADAQVGLSLRILCGFGIEEIAAAFLTNKETINKRLFRAKEKLREQQIAINLPPPAEIDSRLKEVLTTIYLLFSEGYYSATQATVIRKDLCLEAMRLCYMLVENRATNKPEVNALLALMCFHASRLEARTTTGGEPVLYEDQDTTLWDTELVRKGEYFLNCAATGNKVSRYHLEAAIAYWHTHQADTPEKWENILQLYNQLLLLQYTPIAALNRTYALFKARGAAAAIAEAEQLQLTDNHLYYVLLGHLYTGLDDDKAAKNLEHALQLTRTQHEKQVIRGLLEKLGSVGKG